MLNNFENWLLENKYSELTSADYAGHIERFCRKECYTLAHLVENIASILPQYETAGEKSSYSKRSHTSVRQALRRSKMFLVRLRNSVMTDIKTLNDNFHKHLIGGKILLTQGIRAKSNEEMPLL